MSFWTWIKGDTDPPTPNPAPGDPDGVEYDGTETYSRALPFPVPSPWAGWPAEWGTPDWGAQSSLNKLIDVAWGCIDLNSRVLASMPPYRLRNGRIIEPPSWLTNPDETVYTSWNEFARQLFWDFQVAGEVFVLPMAHAADGWPLRFRVIPGWLVNVEMRNGAREYTLGGVGGQNITGEVLHVRNQSTTDDAHGHGPLECAGARMTAAALLQRYASRLAETGGTPHYWINVDRRLDSKEAAALLDQWVESRTRHAGYPALLSGGAGLNQAQSMSAKDMTLLELSQFNESRIAFLLGVPAFLAGLPGPGGLTYANESQLFDFHDRSALRTMADAVMSALSGWALPRGQTIELNRDEYSRPAFKERTDAYKTMIEIGAMSVEEVRAMERLHGDMSGSALTGAEIPSTPTLTPTASPVPTSTNNSEVP